MGIPLERQKRRTIYMSPDGVHRLICLVSHAYPDRSAGDYWFGLTSTQKRFLDEGTAAYIAFGCGSPEKTILMPFDRVSPLLDNLKVTRSGDGNSADTLKWHVDIMEKNNSFVLRQYGSGENLDISQYLLPNDNTA